MAQKTYLEIINSVLVKLRESTVGSPTASTYSTLIGAFVNDAKKEVESAWTWQALRFTYGFSSVIGQRAYALTDILPDSRLLRDSSGRPMVFDRTANQSMQLYEMYVDDLEGQYRLQYPVQTLAQPSFFALYVTATGFNLTFLETPTEVRPYVMDFCVPQDELSTASTLVSVPWRPIRDLAYLYALDERGEEIGEPGSKAWLRYEKSLGDAIAFDSLSQSFRTDFTV